MADSSFDIVSKIDRQEVDNALGQAAREVATRFDFKGTGATIEWKGEKAIEITASADDRASAVLDVFKQKLVKRNVSLKILDASEPAPVRAAVEDRDHAQGGHLLGGRQEDQQADPRRGTQGRQGADPGRRAAGVVEEARRPPGRERAGEGAGLRRRAAVHELPVKARRACHGPVDARRLVGPSATDWYGGSNQRVVHADGTTVDAVANRGVCLTVVERHATPASPERHRPTCASASAPAAGAALVRTRVLTGAEATLPMRGEHEPARPPTCASRGAPARSVGAGSCGTRRSPERSCRP